MIVPGEAAQRVPGRPGRGPGRRRPRPRLARHLCPRGQLRAAQFRATGLRPSGVGFYGAQPTWPLLDAARSFYGVPESLAWPAADPVDDPVDVAVAGGGAAGLVTTLRASLDEELVVAVFEKSAREGCNAAISSGSLKAGGARSAAAGIEDSPQRHADDILAASGDESGDRWSRRWRGRAGGRGVDRGHGLPDRDRRRHATGRDVGPAPAHRRRAARRPSPGAAPARPARRAAQRGLRGRGAGRRSARVPVGRRGAGDLPERELRGGGRTGDRAGHRRVRGRSGADG